MKKLLAIALAAFAMNASAFSGNGNNLAVAARDYTNDNVHFNWWWYTGTVAGVADVWSKPFVGALAICYPKGATVGQLSMVTAKYLDEHPERLHEGASELIWESHFDAFGLQANDQCWRHQEWTSWNR